MTQDPAANPWAAQPLPAAGCWTWPRWTAHRGAGRLAPENTLAAFRAGAALGWRAFECDVKLSADGLPFLLHDATLERTTNGLGLAGALPWADLARLDAGSWHSARHAGEPLPLLADIARFVQAGGHALNVEIKPTPGQEAATGHAVAAACAQLWAGSGAPLLLSSFSRVALAAAQAGAPRLPRALLLDERPADALAAATALGCVALVVHHPLADAALLAAARARGLGLLCYTVNEVDEAARLLQLGVDGLISDAVDRLGPGSGSKPG